MTRREELEEEEQEEKGQEIEEDEEEQQRCRCDGVTLPEPKKLPEPREADQSAALFQEEKQEKKGKETMINVIGLFTLPST